MCGYALNTMTPKGSFTRRYFVMLPKTYDPNKPHRVVFAGPKCGGLGYEVPAFDSVATTTDDAHGAGVIQVGLTPDPTVWMAGCFDQQAGGDTIEKAFIEALWPVVTSSFCVDEHRVFMAGHDSGAWLANQLGHVYGSRMFRAIAPSAGGLATGAALQPCLTAGLPGSQTTVGGCLPTPGIWWHDSADTVDAFAGTKQAVETALVANHCVNATFAAGPKTPFATLQHATCVSYSTCPAAFPVVLCTASQQDHKNLLDDPANLAATWMFLRGF
jgi:poly(3-hydroxybutyrate) depolymerase